MVSFVISEGNISIVELRSSNAAHLSQIHIEQLKFGQWKCSFRPQEHFNFLSAIGIKGILCFWQVI